MYKWAYYLVALAIDLIGSVVDGYFPNSAQCDKYNPSVAISFYDWLEKNPCSFIDGVVSFSLFFPVSFS